LTAYNDIDSRLINWSRWLRSMEHNRGSCITGIICANMREAALGNVWSGHDIIDRIDIDDAQCLERCMRKLLKPVRDVLRHHYVEGMRWQIICRHARVRVSQEHFATVLKGAQAAIECASSMNDHDCRIRKTA
jgi:DNA-directed RNA polymerase specialized sigma24 family protein